MKKSITFEDFNCDEAAEASKLVDYYEDEQDKYVAKLLDDNRDEWRTKNMRVNSRNIVRSIVDKSGLLFNNPPQLGILPPGKTKPVDDFTFKRVMDRAGWLEFFQNVDVYTRLLKSTVVLQQKYIATDRTTVGGSYKFDEGAGDALLLSLLNRGNCVVRTDITGKIITELAFLTSPKSQLEAWTYRVITPTEIGDITVEGGMEVEGLVVPNPEGFVPATVFYDTRVPVNKFWLNPPEDIGNFQDTLNLFLCDVDYARAHQMQKSLFLDSLIIDTEANTGMLPAAQPGHMNAGDEQWNMVGQKGKKSIGGLGSIVYLEKGMTGQSPMVKFDGPESDLKALYDIVSAQAKDVASDWDVTLRTDTQAKANSGYQVVVEEMDNLALREKRAHSMQAGLRRFYDVTQRLYPEMQEGTLTAEFAPPSLPVNRLEEEQVWQYRLQSGAYTVLDRLMADGMTEEDALAKLKRDAEVRKLLADVLPPPVPVAAPTKPTDPSQKGGNPPAP